MSDIAGSTQGSRACLAHLPGTAAQTVHRAVSRVLWTYERYCLKIPMLLLAVAGTAMAGREVAITFDDLPRGGDGGGQTLADIRSMTARLVKPFHDGRLPLTGFVNACRVSSLGTAGLREILDQWLDAGAELGNHSCSHLNINKVALDEYTADIVKGEPPIREALAARDRTLRYYRHPFLFTGPTAEVKARMQAFLDEKGYRVAPVTIDDADYEFAALYTRPAFRERVRAAYVPYLESVVEFFERRSIEVVGREFPQILLLHASQLNADLMPEMLAMFKRRGYTLVTLDRALADDAYRLADDYVGKTGFSWIHRWSKTKGMEPKGEPDPPKWVEDSWAVR